MVINILNQFIDKHARIIYGIFAILIILAFMPGAVSMLTGSGQSMSSSSVGKVFQEDVTIDDLRSNARKSSIMMSLQYNAPFKSQPVTNDNLKDMLSQYASLIVAKKRGFYADDAEVAEFIQTLPHFKEKNIFSYQKYDKFITEKMDKYGVSKLEIDNAIKVYLILNKLQKSITENIFVTESEIKTFYNIWNEEIVIKKALFKTDDYKSKVKVDDTKLQAYLDEHKVNFQIPAQYKVATVKFDNSAYLAKAQGLVTDKEIEEYYNGHKYNYIKKPAEKDSKKEKDSKEPPKTEYKPLKEVSDEIKTVLVTKKSEELALEKAKVLSNIVFEGISELPQKEHYNKFIEIAEKAKQKVVVSDWFNVESTKVKGFDGEIVFRDVPKIDKEYKVSNALKGIKSSCVTFLTDEKSANFATLSQVKEDVKTAFVKVNAANLADTDARAFIAEIHKELEKGSEFSKIKGIEKFKDSPSVKRNMMDLQFMMNPRYAKYYNQYQGANKIIHNTPTGQISEASKTRTGTDVVYVVERKLPDVKKLEEEKIKQQLIGIKSQVAFGNFLKWLNENSRAYTKK